ncbi:AzlC family ABC transporter permease [Methanocorpusculum sp.]|nr:AzlC family ABC transporter permease [Methanocorpusculum sp.]MBP3444194.1 AzlC family ABC transporter permease [Methanocorpusculaceae archaeon]
MSKRDEYLAGARAGIPVLLGFIPVGIAYAIMARQAGFDIFETCFMSVAVFAGASQMMAVGMYAQGAGLAVAGILAWKKAPVMVSVLGAIGAVFVLYLVI